MEFRFEDILKNIIPGMIALTGVLAGCFRSYTFEDFKNIFFTDLKDYSEIILVMILVASYLSGYIVDAVSSFLEHYCIYKIVGTPSMKLLTGANLRINLVNYEEVINHIIVKFSLIQSQYILTAVSFNKKKDMCSQLFKYANILKDRNDSEAIKDRVKEYYYSYLFSRNLCFSFLITSITLTIALYRQLSLGTIIIFIIVNLILLYRRYQRSYYYSRQVFLAALD